MWQRGYIFRAVSPAANGNGSKTIYEKFVNNQGATTKYIKTTIDAEGNIIHVKPKM